MRQLSPKAQRLWDQYGEALEKHIDASSDIRTPLDQRRVAAAAYLQASRKLHNYITLLELKLAGWERGDR